MRNNLDHVLVALSKARLASIALRLGSRVKDRRVSKSFRQGIIASCKTRPQLLTSELTIAELRAACQQLGGVPRGRARGPIEKLFLALLEPTRASVTGDASQSAQSDAQLQPLPPPPLPVEGHRQLDRVTQEQFLDRAESQYFDRKSKDKKPAEVAGVLASFANAEGGELVLGVHDTKSRRPDRLDGFDSEEAANAHLSTAYFGIQPAIVGLTHYFYRYRDAGPGHYRFILHFDVPRSNTIHYASDHRCFIRKGAQTIQVPDSQISSVLFSKGVASYEDTPVNGFGPPTLLKHKPATEYFSRIRVSDPERFLRSQRLVVLEPRGTGECVSTAAVLLLDESPQAALPTKCAIKLTRLETTESTYDRKWVVGAPRTIEGDLETLIYQAVKETKAVLEAVSFERAGALVKLQFPTEALHELIANAVLHRDYSIKDDIHIRVYNNRIEIQSPGRLPGPVTVQNIREAHFARNSKIVRLLNKLPSPPNQDIARVSTLSLIRFVRQNCVSRSLLRVLTLFSLFFVMNRTPRPKNASWST